MGKNEHLLKLIEPVLADCGVQLYELQWIADKDHTLQIAIMKPDGSMDLDTCATVSEQISAVLDQDESLNTSYTLEVCSPGAEREIRSQDELRHLQGKYVYLRLKEPIGRFTELTGTVLANSEDGIELEYRDKAAVRRCSIAYENIDFIRMAVKF